MKDVTHIPDTGPQTFEDLKAEFGKSLMMPELGDPEALFMENIQFINSQNVLFLEGELAYSLTVNSFAAISFKEFAQRQSGMGLFSNNFTDRPVADSKGVLE